MKITSFIYAFYRRYLPVLLSALLFSSCIYINTRDDSPAPRGISTRSFALTDFNRLALGSAFSIRVTRGVVFRVEATGELNDLNDLETRVNSAGVLEINYRNTWRQTRQRMDIDIVMPGLRGAIFRERRFLPLRASTLSLRLICCFQGPPNLRSKALSIG